jgi:nucleotide-binding universal stress UspA family protein
MFRQLLVPLDRSPLAEQAVGRAAAIARAAHAHIDLVLVHEPLPFAGFGDAPWNEDQWVGEQKYLERMVEEVASGATVSVSHDVMRGGVVEMICKRALDVDADLIVMTSHGRTGVSRAWLGSVADGVIRRSGAPVLLLHPIETKSARSAAHHLFKKVLVPLDGSAIAADALASAGALARCSDAKLVLLRVVKPVPMILVDPGLPLMYPPPVPDDVATNRLVDEAKEQLADVAARTAETAGVKVEPHVVEESSVAHAIITFACGNAVDVIAMSTHGRGASRLLIGSVADKVLRGSGLPILLHRPIGVVEPTEAATPPFTESLTYCI